MLVWNFIREFNDKMGRKIQKVSKKDMALRQSYSWPGNIRELRNVIEHAVIMSSGDELKVHIPEGRVSDTAHNVTLGKLEAAHIKRVLQQTGWRIKGDGSAAQILGLNPSTLYSRMKKLGISIPHPEKDYIST